MSKPRYNLVNYQGQPGHKLLIDQRHYHFARSRTLSMSQLGHDLGLSMPQLGHDLELAMPQLGHDLELSMPQIEYNLVNYQCLK